jgi:CIC family chloride channel protein
VRKLVSYLQKLHHQPRVILQTLAYGIAGGCGAIAFQVAMNALYRATYIRLATQTKVVFLSGTFGVIVVTSLLVGYLLNAFCPQASGSGIPQLKLAFWKDFGAVPWRITWVKFVAGVLSIGGGSSLGREGPSVQIAAGLASNTAGAVGEVKQSRRVAAAAGAAAGLAAAFNTPLAAVTFVLEEVIQDLNSNLLGSVLLASVVGAFLTHALIGKQPAFTMAAVEPSSWQVYLLVPVVAAASSIVGLIFQKVALGLRGRRKLSPRVPLWFRPAIGAMITWVLGVSVFLKTGSLGVFGLGYDDLSTALTQSFAWKLAGILLVTKLIATIACYGFGSCGGIFSPTLFLGGMCGIFFGGALGTLLHLSGPDQIVLAVIGMSTCLGAVVRAPVTGILIVFEMTHEFSMVPALMLGALVSQAISRRLSKHSFYEAILVQDGHQLQHVVPPRDLRAWQRMPVSAVANSQAVTLDGLERAKVRTLLESFPYSIFPVLQNGTLAGVLSRKEADAALKENRLPSLVKVPTCRPSQSIRDVEMLLIESPVHVVVLQEHDNGKILGLLTLHDLLRAELAFAEQQG